ncbi:MAG: polyprenyl synthetase family protein [Candidatus Omnitrophota bacterium]
MLKQLKISIDKELKSFLKNSENDFSLKKNSLLLYNGLQDFLSRKGKRIRPIFFILSYLGYTKKRGYSQKKLIQCSLALELLHDFLLIHDDIIDKSDLRRGKPTLHRLFNKNSGQTLNNELGNGLAIVAGNIVFAMAVTTLLSFNEKDSRKIQALSAFIEMTVATGTGEFIDVINNMTRIDRIKKKDVLLTYTLKTAKYTFEAPLLMGAHLAGIGENPGLKSGKTELSLLSTIGNLIGQAFQIQDDLLDIFSSSKKTGKPVLSDLAESKKTLLIWKTYNSLKGCDKKTLKKLLEKDKKTYKDLLAMQKFIKISKAGEYCGKKAKSLLRKAFSLCSRLKMKPKYRNMLESFVQDLIQQ